MPLGKPKGNKTPLQALLYPRAWGKGQQKYIKRQKCQSKAIIVNNNSKTRKVFNGQEMRVRQRSPDHLRRVRTDSGVAVGPYHVVT